MLFQRTCRDPMNELVSWCGGWEAAQPAIRAGIVSSRAAKHYADFPQPSYTPEAEREYWEAARAFFEVVVRDVLRPWDRPGRRGTRGTRERPGKAATGRGRPQKRRRDDRDARR